MKPQVDCIFILFFYNMTIRVVTLSRWQLGGLNAEAFLFHSREAAIAHSKALLFDEQSERDLRETDFRLKTDTHIKYIDDFGTYAFEIVVEQKQIK